MTVAFVEYSVANAVAHIELNRPEAANAFDLQSARELAIAVERAREDDAVRSILVTGRGRRFCGGGDVASFAAAEDAPAYMHHLAVELDEAFRTLRELAKPDVAAVDGAVAGAGLALMLSCDVVVAGPQTKFVFAYPAIGLTPDCGLSYLLPRAIGQQRALAFSLMDAGVGAGEALGWGLITEVADEPGARAQHIATAWSAAATTALGQVRRLMRDTWDMDAAAVGAKEARTIAQMAREPEAQRLIGAFLTQ